MKKKIKTHGLIAIIAVITLSFTVALVACDNGNNDNGKPKTYTVTFNADNGTVNTTQTVTEGGKATKPANPTKDGYGFGYWFNVATNSEWDFDTIITADITLKAEWTPDCTITNHAIDDDLSCGHTAKVYGTINGIPVYRTKAVTETQATAAYTVALAGYNSMTAGALKDKIATTKVSQIVIDTADDCTVDGSKWLIKVAYNNTSSQMRDLFGGVAGSVITMMKTLTPRSRHDGSYSNFIVSSKNCRRYI
jgi:uncharacterized membrane protein